MAIIAIHPDGRFVPIAPKSDGSRRTHLEINFVMGLGDHVVLPLKSGMWMMINLEADYAMQAFNPAATKMLAELGEEITVSGHVLIFSEDDVAFELSREPVEKQSRVGWGRHRLSGQLELRFVEPEE